MIEPISIKLVSMTIRIANNFTCSSDIPGQKSKVEACIIDSGLLKGTVVAHIRYLSSTTDTDYPWQVIKQRTQKDCDRFHYSTTKTLEQALNLVMACAYEYTGLNGIV